MKKVTFILRVVLIAAIFTVFSGELNAKTNGKGKLASIFNEITNPFEEVLKAQGTVLELNPLTDITVIEEEEEIDLGIEVETYLPYGFNALRGFQMSIEDVKFIEIEEEVELDFDIRQYLPENFNPYKA